MLTRIFAVALAAGSLCFPAAYAQTSSDKTQPSAGEQPQQAIQQPSGTTDSTKPSGGQQPQQPIHQPTQTGTPTVSKPLSSEK